MGSKLSLLQGQLGTILLEKQSDSTRFIDLFSGSGAVSHFMSMNSDVEVLAVDQQHYARTLAAAIIERTDDFTSNRALRSWISAAQPPSKGHGRSDKISRSFVLEERIKAQKIAESGFITRHYGGYYFSVDQGEIFDMLYDSLPEGESEHTVALAALLQAASSCAAAPGHTAQPFQPTPSLLPYIEAAWSKDAYVAVDTALNTLLPRHAMKQGRAIVGDAESVVERLQPGDLVFCDPPYSAVQYSRFYHVLEGIARGGWRTVTGAGRAPDRRERSTSDFSMKSRAETAMSKLLRELRSRECRVVITFPTSPASNGLSSKKILELAGNSWTHQLVEVASSHSTLGGSNGEGMRGGRRNVCESVIVLDPS